MTSRPSPRLIAVVPAYNEEQTVAQVLEKLSPIVDHLIIVDDGSTDRTRQEILDWLAVNDDSAVELLSFEENRGMSAAYYLAFTTLRARLEARELNPEDLVCTIDADGQHELAELERLVQLTRDDHLDALLARRDLSDYPPYKQLGNLVMSKWATLWAGTPMPDVESGYRIFRLAALAHALDYYRGYKYSETVEVAVVLARLGYRVRNDVLVPVPVFRSRTSLLDAAIDFAVMPRAWWRVQRRRSRVVQFALPALAVTGMVGFCTRSRRNDRLAPGRRADPARSSQRK